MHTTNKREGKGTTRIGYKNGNGQQVIEATGQLGTDHMQYVYRLLCTKCQHTYGSNGTDIWQRKCSNCQGGAQGPPLP